MSFNSLLLAQHLMNNKRDQVCRPARTRGIQSRCWPRPRGSPAPHRDLHVIAFGKLKIANEVGAFLYDLARWAHHLISHPRAAFFVQQVHVNALILDCGMDFDGNGNKAEGKNAAASRLAK